MFYKLEYYSNKAVGNIPSGFHFWFYIDAAFAENAELVIEEGDEDGYLNFYPTFQKSTKNYTLETVLIPENIIDAINRFKYFQVKTITIPDGTIHTMNNVKTSMSYPFDDKCFAIAKISFDIDEVLILTGCLT